MLPFLFIRYNEVHNKKIENQCAYKPGSVPLQQRCLSFIYYCPRRQSLATYPLTSDGQPYMRQYTWSCNPWYAQPHMLPYMLVGPYPTFSPLPLRAVIFFCAHLPLLIASTFRNTVSCIARTFLSQFALPATNRRTVFI